MADDLRQHFSPADAEWIVMGVGMMGFLNKFMDGVGVELEQESIDDVAELIAPTGWSVGQHDWAHESPVVPHGGVDEVPVDSWRTMIPVLKNAPGAVRLEHEWMKGVSKDRVEARRWIAEEFGFDEPLLTELNHAKPTRALTAMLRHNLDPTQSTLGIGLKALVGLVFAQVVENASLARSARSLAHYHGLSEEVISVAEDPDSNGDSTLDVRARAALTLARAISPSPAAVAPEVVELAEQQLSPTDIVELAVWVSVGQLQHRLRVYFEL